MAHIASLVLSQMRRTWIASLIGAFAVAAACDVGSAQDLAQRRLDNLLKQKQMNQDLRAIRNSLLTDELKSDFEKIEKTFRTVISQGTTERGGARYDALKTGLTYYVYQATDPEIYESNRGLTKALDELTGRIQQAGNLAGNQADKKRFRTLVCKEVLELLEDLLKNNLNARSFAIEIYQYLKTVEGSGGERAELYDRVDEALIAVFRDPEQSDFVKLRAANTVSNILEAVDLNATVQVEFAKVLSSELSRKESEIPYQLILLETMCRITTPRDVVAPKKAIVFESCAVTMQDNERDLMVRCRAARALGRAGFDADINFDPLAWKTVELAIQTALTFNATNPGATIKGSCGLDLHLAFHHDDRAGFNNRRNPQGFLNRAPNSSLVHEAYKVVLGITNDLISNNGKVGNKDINAADVWLRANRPQNLVYDSASPPINP